MGGAKDTFKMDDFPNRMYQKVTTPADNSAIAYTQFTTGQSAREGYAWIIERLDVMPGVAGAGGFEFAASSSNTLFIQLCEGKQTALLDQDDPKAIATMALARGYVTSGANVELWPMSWQGPAMVASKDMTALIQASADQVAFDSEDLIFEIWYRWIELKDARAWLNLHESRGG